jgi:hypothetical protein
MMLPRGTTITTTTIANGGIKERELQDQDNPAARRLVRDHRSTAQAMIEVCRHKIISAEATK